MKKWMKLLGLATLLTLVSCSNDDYVNVIPGESVALVSIDVPQLTTQQDAQQSGKLFQSLLGTDNPADCGIDIEVPLYFFETADGTLGLCAKVKDDGRLDDFLNNTLHKRGDCHPTTERKGFRFTVLKNSWVLGFSSRSLLLMGPVVKTEQARLQQQMARYLEANEEDGIFSSPLYDRLDSIDAPIRMVARAQALPEVLMAPATLGLPKDTDASRALLSAGVKVTDGVVVIEGNTFSLNADIDAVLKKSHEVYRPITSDYVLKMSKDDLGGVFLNVEGESLLGLLRSNKGIQALLAGINTAVDMDNIIRSIDGDALFLMKNGSKRMAMSARLSSPDWLKDVDYWKTSCPQGSRIEDKGKNTFCYIDGSQDNQQAFYFGVTDDNRFWGGTGSEAASVLQPSPTPLPKAVQSQVIGQKMAIVVNFKALEKELGKEASELIGRWIRPLLGDVNTIIYIQQ